MKKKALAICIVILLVAYLVFAYARVYTYVNAVALKSPYTDQSFVLLNPKATGEVKYVALGDSLGAGVGSKTVEQTYVYQYALKLVEKYGQVDVVNLCTPGATTVGVLSEQLPRTIAANPDFVTLMIGTNDAHSTDPGLDFAGNYKAIVTGLATGTPAKITVINIPYLGAPTLVLPPYNLALDWRINRYNGVIHALVTGTQMQYVDLYTAAKHLSGGHNYYSTDLFHPSGAGYVAWAKIINAYSY